MKGEESMGRTKTVITIPATLARFTETPLGEQRSKRRIAAYARVSTDSAEQASSYEAQVKYYTEFIKGKEEWEFVKVYTDEGISGTSTSHREGFKSMVDDAIAGKIDLILTKSVSRFARNTVDSLVAIRKLKEKGVEVFFEKENIWTFDGKGEVLLTIMSSLAQEESRSISENVTWGIRKRLASGKVIVGYKNFLGYDKGPDGELVINEEQAKIVRFIFSEFLMGKAPRFIASELTQQGIKTMKGKDHWQSETILGILRNEKYEGNAILQKTYTVDFLTKKTKVNHGEVPMYLVENNHPAIIPCEQFEAAQVRLSKLGQKVPHGCTSPFSGRVKCADCGSIYSPKTWHSNDKYRKTVWQCLNKFNNDRKCTTPHLLETELEEVYIKAVNELIVNVDEVKRKVEDTILKVLDTSELEQKKAALDNERAQIIFRMEQALSGPVSSADSQEMTGYNGLVKRLEENQNEGNKLSEALSNMKLRKASITTFLSKLTKQNSIKRFSGDQFLILVDYIVVYSRTKINVVFKDGTVISGGLVS